MWWLAQVLSLEQRSFSHIENLRNRFQERYVAETITEEARLELNRQDNISRECEEYLRDSRRLLDLVELKAKGKTKTKRINPLASSKHSLKVINDKKRKYLKTKGIEVTEIKRKKEAGECLRCAWPPDQKGHHWVKDCLRNLKLDSATAKGLKTIWIEETLEESSADPEDTKTEYSLQPCT